MEFWRQQLSLEASARLGAVALSKIFPDLDALQLPANMAFSQPIELLVGSKKASRSNASFKPHQCTKLPKSSLISLGKELVVVSPELCLLQMATRLSLVEAIALGYEFCGGYRLKNKPANVILLMLDDNSPSLFAKNSGSLTAKPLTSTARLTAYLAKMSNHAGIKQATRALRFVADNSASPMESALAMLLCLPYMLGGFKLPMPMMNARIPVIGKARQVTTSKSLYCDLFWPDARLAVEYDSDAFHNKSEQIAHDASRRNALAFIGIEVVTVTKRQLQGPLEMRRVAELIGKRLGKRLQYRDPGFGHANDRLRKELLG
ncbi:MAG: hypothetical protein LBK67_04255 [Coriobacteriales bacterium]|nr:hypothetical protein [Coriobacteriales bacterium]